MNYQWFPGHMTKAIRSMQEDIKLIDLIIEIVDARIPISSRNPEIDRFSSGKGRLILINKSDLSDKYYNEKWIEYFKAKGYTCLLIDSKTGRGLKDIQSAVLEACKEKLERDKRKGIQNRPLRAMICGIPNVGKSTFINAYAKKSCTKTGNKPGVTKGKQWIRLNKNLELLDTPGILWPKFEDQTIGLHLAMIGSINDEILYSDELCLDTLDFLKKRYAGRILERYGTEEVEDNLILLNLIARKRACLLKGGLYDMDKASKIVLDDFRSGKLGNLTIERPEDYESK